MEAVSAPSPSSGQPGTPGTVRANWGLPLAVLVVGMFMSVLDMTIVNVAIPTIQRDFGASTQDIQWITNAYTLTLGVVVPLSGWLGDRLGLTKVYFYGLIGFSVASGLCGLAWDLNSMIAFRILQAVPGGILPVVTMTMVYHLVPPKKMGTAMGMYGLGIILGPAIGPTLGGYLVEYTSWRLIFLINVPIGILGAMATLAVLPKVVTPTKRPLDRWGFFTIASGLFALLLACSKAPDWGWTSYPTLMLITYGVLALALFTVIELEVDEPLIDLRVLRIWPFTNSLLLIGILSVGLYAVLFFLPLFMQESQHLQALHTGLLLFPEALTMAITMPVAGRLYDRFGPRWPAVIGLSIAALGGFLLVGITPEMTQGDVVLWTCVRAFGNGIAMMPIFTAGLASVPLEFLSSGSPANNIVQRASAALGLAAMTAMATDLRAQLWADRAPLTNRSLLPPGLRGHLTEQGLRTLFGYYQALQVQVTADTYSNVFLVAAVLTVVGIGLAFLMSGPRATEAAGRPAPGEDQTPVTELVDAPAGESEARVADPGRVPVAAQ